MKKRARNLQVELHATGGGPSTNLKLTALEERLLATLGRACVEGMQDGLDLTGQPTSSTSAEYFANVPDDDEEDQPAPSPSKKYKKNIALLSDSYNDNSKSLLVEMKEIKRLLTESNHINQSLCNEQRKANEMRLFKLKKKFGDDVEMHF